MVTSKSDKETVIEMGPVNNEKKFRLLTYGSFFLSFSIVIISILFFYQFKRSKNTIITFCYSFLFIFAYLL